MSNRRKKTQTLLAHKSPKRTVIVSIEINHLFPFQ